MVSWCVNDVLWPLSIIYDFIKSTCEIYFYTVEAEEGALKEDGTAYTPMDLLTVQNWIIVPQLRNLKGVVEVNTIGGYEQQFHVQPYPDRLLSYDLSIHDVISALETNNANAGAGYIERNGEQYLVRIPGQVEGLDDISNIIVTKRDELTIRIKDVASVKLGAPLRTGAATENGEEIVLGTAMMLMGENSRDVSYRDQDCDTVYRQECQWIPAREDCQDVPIYDTICRDVTQNKKVRRQG